MNERFITLDRAELLKQILTFIELSYDCTIASARAGGSSYRMGQIPQALRESPKNVAGYGSVSLSGAEADAYNDLQRDLSNLRETEWLATEQLDGKLWELTCEIAITPGDFDTGTKRLARGEQLLANVLRDLRRYEVVFSVEHVTPPSEPIAVWDARLLAATPNALEPFVKNAPEEIRESLQVPFLGKTALVVQVDGTAASPVIVRARRRASHRLHVLRGSLAAHWQTHPEQLLFTLGDDAIARSLSGDPDGLPVWKRPPASPIDLGIHPGHADRLHEMQEAFARLPSCHVSVGEAVERAFEWIGRGLCRHWAGDALRDFTTAIEVLLVASDKEQKSVLVPYRMLALAELHGARMIHPTAVRHAYDRRSIVVHEGVAEAGDDQSTRRMLAAARDCIGWLTTFAVTQPVEDHATLLDALDTPSGRTMAIASLASLTDPWSTRLVAGIQSLRKSGSAASK